MHETMDMADDQEYEEEEPSFSDSEDFVDDIEDDGRRPRRKHAGFWACYRLPALLTGLMLS